MLKTQSISLRLVLAGAVVLTFGACHASSQAPLPGVSTSQSANTKPLFGGQPPLTERSLLNHSLPQQSTPPTPWLSAQAASGKNLVYAGNTFTNGTVVGAIDIYSVQDPSHTAIGVITDGVNQPQQLAIDRAGNLYVANSGNNTVTVYPPGKLSPSITYSRGVSTPWGVAVGKDGTVYIANETGSSQGTGSVTVYPAGTTKPSKTFTLSGQYAFAVGLDANNNLYASWWNPNTMKIQIEKYSPTATSAAGSNLNLDLPQGSFPAFDLVFDNSGNLVLAWDNYYYEAMNYFAVFTPGKTEPARKIYFGGLFSTVQGIAFPRDSSQFFVASANDGNWMQATYPSIIPRNVQSDSGVGGLVLSPGT